MSSVADSQPDAVSLVRELKTFLQEQTKAYGSSKAVDPGHRVKFHWPPHPVSYSFHVLASDWTGKAHLEIHGEQFEIAVARTPHGVFGKCEALWLEARGDTEESMLTSLRRTAEPLFQRQFAIAKALGAGGRFTGHIPDLGPLDLLKLLYCEDRDVANDARIEIEKHARSHVFTPSLIAILRDQLHPYRRSAQWCVLDLFEDLPTFCSDEAEELEAIEAMTDLIWSAEDDFARTIYKAGVVLGGHIPHKHGGPVLIECLKAPSSIGRRSAIHGLFHVVEWIPEMRTQVVAALRETAENDHEALLREYAEAMANDIDHENLDHIVEPVLPEEAL